MTSRATFVDCSSNNPLPDLLAYKNAGHRHICRKVSEGADYHWFDGDGVADKAHVLGLRVGHYHWLRPDSSATAQAAFFVTNVVPHLKPGDWLMTDFEATSGVSDGSDVERAAALHQFNSYVREKLPDVPLFVYTGNWYLDGKPHCQAECRHWPVVMSDYSGATSLPNPYGLRYVAWQFTDRANVTGFAAPVDYNRWLDEPQVKYPADHPKWSDTVTKDEVLALIRGEITDAERAVQKGGDHGYYTQKRFAALIHDAGHGVQDRLNALENDAKPAVKK